MNRKEILCRDFKSQLGISMHDWAVAKIVTSVDSVVFGAQGDVYLSEVDDNQTCGTKEIRVTIHGCAESELSCYIVHRYAPFHRSIRISKSVKLSSIQKLLRKGKKLELVDEFYTDTQLYWKFSVSPSKRTGLSDEIEIRTNTFKSIEYEWPLNLDWQTGRGDTADGSGC